MQKSKICNIVYTEQSTDIHKKEQRRAESRNAAETFMSADRRHTMWDV